MITVRIMRPLADRLSPQRQRTRALKMARRRDGATARWRQQTTTRGTAGASFLNFWRALTAVRPTLKTAGLGPSRQDRKLYGAIAREIAKRMEPTPSPISTRAAAEALAQPVEPEKA